MNHETAHAIAQLAIRQHHAKAALEESERLGQRQTTRDNHASLSAVEKELRDVIEQVND
jgi:hypothetical protein